MNFTAKQWSIVIATGLALFAMFFGAGNMIFPLKVGSLAGTNLSPAIIAFIISGVGVPFLGVFAISLYDGNYWQFFNRLNKPIGFLIISFLILIIGPLFGAPRTEIITYNTLLPLLPSGLDNLYVFDAIYFLVVFLIVYKQSRIVDIIGWIFSPLKIATFSILILCGIFTTNTLQPSPIKPLETFVQSLTSGYGTMDLLGAFFFCSVVHKNLVCKTKALGITSRSVMLKMMLTACIIGALLISFIYAGFIYISAAHAAELINIPTEALIGKISTIILGHYGTIFVGVCVTIACLATGATLCEVTTDYVYQFVFREEFPRITCLILVVLIMMLMAIMGFASIMKIALPILEVLYPLLIILCLVNIAKKLWYIKITPTN